MLITLKTDTIKYCKKKNKFINDNTDIRVSYCNKVHLYFHFESVAMFLFFSLTFLLLFHVYQQV